MYKLGLTGGIASGKSTVSEMLKKLGAAVIDYDQVAKELEKPNTLVWREICETFGSEILFKDGTINRKALGERVFNNPEALKKLNQIVHPRVAERVKEIINGIKSSGLANVVVLDVALLIEAKMTGQADEVWLVSIPEEEQVKRLMARNGLTSHEALSRVRSQMPLKDKLAYADKVIDNSGTIAETKETVIRLWQYLQHRISAKDLPEG